MNRPKWLRIVTPLVVLALIATLCGLPLAQGSGPSGYDSWTQRGPQHNIAAGEAPMVVQIFIDPSNPNLAYAGTNQGVYRSADGGETWEPRNGGLGGYGDLVITGLVRHPTDPQTLYIGTWGYGLFRSTAGGANWTRLTDPLKPAGLEAGGGGDAEPPRVRAGGYSYTYGLPQALPDGALPAQADALPQGAPSPLSWTPVRRVAIHPLNPNELFACLDAGHGLYTSSDGGATWTKISLGTGSARTYTFAPSNSQIRYASFGTWSSSGGFYRTTNGGGSWTPVGGNINATVTAVAIHPTNPNTVLAATSGDGLYRSTNGGDIWTQVGGSLADDTFFSVAFAPSNPSVAYAGGYYRIYRSTESGASWATADSSRPVWYAEGLAIHPSLAETVLVGANYFPDGGVHKRTSSGSPFVLKATGMDETFVLDIEQDPNNANRLFAATWGGGIFRSDNDGLTWSARYAVPYVYTLKAVNSGGNTTLYAGTFYVDWGILRSTDLGDSWTDISGGHYYSSDISFDLESAGSGLSRLVAATYKGIEYSDDGGYTWQPAGGLDTNTGVVLRLGRSPTNASQLLAATYGGGIWASTNAGQNWTETSSGLGSPYVYDVAFAPANASLIYAASYGVYRSTNGGSSWAFFGIPDTWIRALAAPSGAHPDAFAGTHNRGVFMTPDGNGTWFPINAGLAEWRIRALEMVSTNKLLAGTNGRSAWEYTLLHRQPTVFLPLVLRQYSSPSDQPPIAPTLYTINNPDGDGNYTVSWSSVSNATSYLLQEDDNAAFTSPTTAYSGPNTSKAITGKSSGTYYYRVRASNAYGNSSWSNTQSVEVALVLPTTFYSIADACVLQGYPTTNLGNTSDMWAGYDDYLSPDGQIARSLVKFDLSAIPTGTPISQATLRLYLVSSYDYPNTYRTITTYRTSGSWTEMGVTWNNKPGYAEAYGSTSIKHGAWGWYSFNVTSLVQKWVNGTATNYGIMLRGPEVSGADCSWRGFSTRQGSYTPQLQITYSRQAEADAAAPPEPDAGPAATGPAAKALAWDPSGYPPPGPTVLDLLGDGEPLSR